MLYSFLLAVPTLIGASGYDLLVSVNQFTPAQENLLLVGGVTSFLVALVVIKLFLSYIQDEELHPLRHLPNLTRCRFLSTRGQSSIT